MVVDDWIYGRLSLMNNDKESKNTMSITTVLLYDTTGSHFVLVQMLRGRTTAQLT